VSSPTRYEPTEPIQRVDNLIPTSGSGTSGTNDDETSFGYDVMKRRNQPRAHPDPR